MRGYRSLAIVDLKFPKMGIYRSLGSWAMFMFLRTFWALYLPDSICFIRTSEAPKQFDIIMYNFIQNTLFRSRLFLFTKAFQAPKRITPVIYAMSLVRFFVTLFVIICSS